MKLQWLVPTKNKIHINHNTMYLNEKQLEIQAKVLDNLSKHYSAKTDFALYTENKEVIRLHKSLKTRNNIGGYKFS